MSLKELSKGSLVGSLVLISVQIDERKLGKWKSKITDRSLLLEWNFLPLIRHPPPPLPLFSSLFSFSNKLPIAIEIPDESHRLILSFYICVSRSTLLFEDVARFKASHRCRHKETRLCILSRVISFWSKRNYNWKYFIPIMYSLLEQGNRPLKIIFKSFWRKRINGEL